MKKRIYKINNKNLVTGNPNEVTENEILVKENNDGTVELSHRNNGTLETLGSGGNSTPKIETDIRIEGTIEGGDKTITCTQLSNFIDINNISSLDDLPDIVNLYDNNGKFISKYQKLPNSFVYFSVVIGLPTIITLDDSTGAWYQFIAMLI